MPKNKESKINQGIFPFVLIGLGVVCLLAAGIFIFDSLTSGEPSSLGRWVFDILILVLGAGASIQGWKGLFKNDSSSSDTKIVATDEAQVATGEHGRNIRQGNDSKYFEKVEHYHEAQQVNVTSSLFTIPPPVRDFTGRDKELDALKASYKNGAVITGVSGGGGFGKTQLARRIAQELVDEYPASRMSIDLLGTSETPLSPEEVMRRILEPFYPNQKLPDQPEQLQGLYQQTFAVNKSLLLLDNAANAWQVRSLIPPAPSAAIITSRWHFSLTEFGLSEPLRLDMLSLGESRELLRIASPKLKNAPNEEVDALAKLCGNLPLALRVTAALLNDRVDWTLATLLKRLEDEHTRLFSFLFPAEVL